MRGVREELAMSVSHTALAFSESQYSRDPNDLVTKSSKSAKLHTFGAMAGLEREVKISQLAFLVGVGRIAK